MGISTLLGGVFNAADCALMEALASMASIPGRATVGTGALAVRGVGGRVPREIGIFDSRC